MAAITGNDGDVTISANVVASILDWSLSQGVTTVESSVLGDDSDTHLVGSKNWSASVNCYWDEGDTAQDALLVNGATVEVHLRPQGAGGGNIDYNGSCTVEGIEIGMSRNGMVTASFTAKGNGALTITTLA